MQTFLPYPDFASAARVLDPRRLGKQRVEALQVLRALTVRGYGWRHHPAVRMWAGYEEALVSYGLEVCRQWCSLGRADTCSSTMERELAERCDIVMPRSQSLLDIADELPPWLGNHALHLSHRSALLRKAPHIYRPIFGDEPDDLPYVWPSSDRLPRTNL
jgi:hypothetical protein